MSENYKRFNLYGKDVTEDELRQHIVKLRKGDPDAKIAPLNPTDIAKKIGYTRQTIHNYIKKAEALGEIQFDKDGKVVIDDKAKALAQLQDFIEFGKDHDILSDPYVKKWWDDIKNRKQGKGIKIARDMVVRIEKLCNVLKIQPIQMLIDKDTTELLKRNFLDAYREGRVPNSRQGSIEGVDYRWSYAMVSFCAANGKNWWGRGSSTMSRKIVGHAKYADERLTDQQFEDIDKYLNLQAGGIDSDLFRVFWAGIETCARNAALTSMTLEHTKHTSEKTGKVTYFMSATETKTAHINGGKWVKYITRPDLQKSIDMALERGQTKLVVTPVSQLAQQLKEMYIAVGINREYPLKHVFHTMRHWGAHYWLKKKHYNHSLVAEIGGWHVVDELKKSYGKMPPEVVVQLLEDEDKAT